MGIIPTGNPWENVPGLGERNKSSFEQRQNSFPKVRGSPGTSMAKLAGFKGIKSFLLPKAHPCCSVGCTSGQEKHPEDKNPRNIFIFHLLQEASSTNFPFFQNSLRVEAQPTDASNPSQSCLQLNFEAIPGFFPKKSEAGVGHRGALSSQGRLGWRNLGQNSPPGEYLGIFCSKEPGTHPTDPTVPSLGVWECTGSLLLAPRERGREISAASGG